MSHSDVFVPEREDTVKVDIFAAYQALLASTTPFSRSQLSDLESMEVTERYTTLLKLKLLSYPSTVPTCCPISLTLSKRKILNIHRQKTVAIVSTCMPQQ